MDNQPEQTPSQPSSASQENTPPTSQIPSSPRTIPSPLSTPAPDERDSTTSPSAPVPPAAFDFGAQPASPSVPPKKRKGWVLAVIIAAILVVLGGGGAFAYTWYQTPEKVITDSMMQMLMAKSTKYTGTITSDNQLLKLKIEVTGANSLSAADVNGKVTATFMGKEVATDISVRFDSDGNLYAKLDKLDATIKSLTEGVPPETLVTLDKIVAKINNQWVKVTPENLATVNPEAAKAQKCTADALKKYQNDKEAMREVASVYEKNKFIKVSKELGLKDYNLGYELKVDEPTVKNFMKEIENTKIFKAVKECSPELGAKAEEETATVDQPVDDTVEAKAEIWVSMWTHEIRKMSAQSNAKDGSSQLKAEVTPEFNKEVAIAAPDNFITYEQLQADIDALVKESEAQQQLQAEENALMLDPAFDSEV